MRVQSNFLVTAAAAATCLATAAPSNAQCGEQHEVVPVPVPCCSDFGKRLAASDSHLVVGLEDNQIHVFNANSLVQLAIFLAPGNNSSGFGESLAIDGTRLVVGSTDESGLTPGVGGVAHVYDLTTYSLVTGIGPDSPAVQVWDFGEQVAIDGEHVAVTCEEVLPSDRTGVVRLFTLEPTPTELLRVEGPVGDEYYGDSIALNDEYLCISGTHVIDVYDVDTLALLGTIDLAPFPGFRPKLALVENRIYAGMLGNVWIFDASTRQQIGLLTPSYLPGENGGYGKDLAASRGNLADARIAVTRENRGSNYVFAAADSSEFGRYVTTLSAPRPTGYGTAPRVAINSTRLFIGEEGYVFAVDLDTPCELTTFCFGDGSQFMPCLCGNESNVGDREGCRNSTGQGVRLTAGGSTALVNDDLQLLAAQGPTEQPGVFIQGSTTISTTFFDGVFCMGNPTQRLQFASFDGAGQLSSTTGLAALGGVAIPGTTRHYQLWYRDPIVSPCGAGANLSNAVRVDWR